MGFESGEEEQRRQLVAVMEQAGISVSTLWLHYFSMTGSVGEYETEAYLQGLMSLPALQRDLLAQAANELLPDRSDLPRAPYSDQATESDSGEEG
jgi:hypothetical protein